MELQQLFLEHLAGLSVDRRKGLIHQQNIRIDRKRPRKADPLLHATAELIRVLCLEAFEADEPYITLGSLSDKLAGRSNHLQAKADIFGNGFPREQAKMLEHNAHSFAR